MKLPIGLIDYEISNSGNICVPAGVSVSRVLVRWHGIPIGFVEVSTAGSNLAAMELRHKIEIELVREFEIELVRRAILFGRSSATIRFSEYIDIPIRPFSGGKLSISIAVCTKDRCEDLRKCLTSISALVLKPDDVIVVDNASESASTRRLVEDEFPAFRYIREDLVGLDNARNRAIRESKSDIIAFTDDDVVVDSRWVNALVDAFSGDDSIALVTGLIVAAEQETTAQVLFERYGGFGRGFTRQYFKLLAGAPMHWSNIGAGQLGAGANMAFRREIFKEVGYFDPALDVGTASLGGGDHEMFYRLLKSGWGCVYEPSAIVRHRHRRTIAELQTLLYNYGYATRCYLERIAIRFPEDRKAVRRLIHWWWLHWAVMRWLKAVRAGSWFPCGLVFREILGFIKGVGGYARSRKSSVSDELRSPDQFRVAARLSPELRKLGKVDVHLEMPLVELIEGRQYCELDVMVFLKRRLVGQFRISSMGSCVSISRLAYAIASHMPSAVLGFGSKNPNLAWAMFYQDLCKTMEDRVFVDLNEVLPSVSVVVATCNRPGSLRKCLQSLCDMAYGGDLEIIVVNNRPGEGRTEDVVREFPFVRVVGESRRGSSFARNAGVAAANGEIIAMTDDDMVVSVEWLDHLVEHFQRADVLAVTGNTLAAKLETQAELDFEKYGGFCRGLASREFSQDWLYRGKAAAPTWEIGGSGNVAFRASIFCDSNIGKFVEVLGAGVPAGVGEDTLMFYQILRSGGKIIYEPTAIAWHHHRVTDGELQRQILAYSKGHVAYHLMTLIRYGDLRSIWRIVFEIPISLTKRIIARVRGRNSYPWKLLITEIIGTLLGPVSLLQSFRHVTRIERKEYSDISANFYSGDREADAPMDPNS